PAARPARHRRPAQAPRPRPAGGLVPRKDSPRNFDHTEKVQARGRHMAVIGGCVFVLVAVLLGFSMAGGHIGALVHPSEFVTIGGAAFGALLVMSPKKVLVDLFRGILQVITGTPYDKAAYAELFKLLAVIARTVRRDGLVSLDAHVTNPHESALFKRYPKIDR